MECHSCLSLSGEKTISPVPPIYKGTYWIVEHAYPTLLAGWLVILLKRHAEALHELTQAEFQELADIQYKLAHITGNAPHIQKEYLFCTGEGLGFQHIHIHFVPKPINLPPSLVGSSIFQLLQVSPEDALSPEKIATVCQQFHERLLQFSE